jgi:hypothetical protein
MVVVRGLNDGQHDDVYATMVFVKEKKKLIIEHKTQCHFMLDVFCCCCYCILCFYNDFNKERFIHLKDYWILLLIFLLNNPT